MLTSRRILIIASGLFTLVLLQSCGTDPAIKYYNMGIDAAEMNDLDTAIRYWKESIKHNPKLPDTRYNLGLALLEKKRYEEAEQQFREAARLKSGDYEIYYGLGKSLEMEGNFSSAKRYYEKALNLKPTYIPAVVGMASVELKRNLDSSAEKYATIALRLDRRNLDANIILAESYFREGKYQESYVQALTGLRYYPRNPDLLLIYGKAAYERRMYADAIDALKSAKDTGKLTDDLFRYLGLTYMAMGDMSKAETNLKLSIYKNRENKESWKSLADLYIESKKYDKALDACLQAELIDSLDAETMLKEGYVYLKIGKYKTAIEKLERSVQDENTPIVAWYYLGLAYAKGGRRSESAEALEKFIDKWHGETSLTESAEKLLDALKANSNSDREVK